MKASFSILCLVALLGACGSSQDIRGAVYDESDESSEGEKEASKVTLTPSVNVKADAKLCSGEGSEACNALDDDCDGTIDEGCSYETGPLRVVAHWSSGADIDLYVRDPNGALWSFQNPESDTIVVDHSGRGSCSKQSNSGVENIRWKKSPSLGRYQIKLHFWGECQNFAGISDVVVSVEWKSKTIGVYRANLRPDEWLDVASFNVE